MSSAPPWDQILACAKQLPATPPILARLQQLLERPDTDLDLVCGLLKRDTSLAARVLQVSNSPYFSPALPHVSLEEAVGCVGYDAICKVVGLTLSAELFACELHHYGIPARRLWENTLACALAMESLAQFIGVDPRSAYTTGLMRSVGKLVLNQLAAEESRLPYSGAAGVPLTAWERVAWGCDNAAAAGFLLEQWNFSGDTVEAVRRHYEPETAFTDAAPAAYLLHFAAGIADDLGHGLPGEAGAWAGRTEKLPLAGLSAAEYELCREETGMAFAQVCHVLA